MRAAPSSGIRARAASLILFLGLLAGAAASAQTAALPGAAGAPDALPLPVPPALPAETPAAPAQAPQSAPPAAPAAAVPASPVPAAPALQPPQAPLPGLKLLVDPARPRPGDPVAAYLEAPADGPKPARFELLAPDGSVQASAPCFSLGPVSAAPGAATLWAAVAAVPNLCAAPSLRGRFAGASGAAQAEADLELTPRGFVREEIPLDQANSELRTLPDPKKAAESEELGNLLYRFDPKALWASAAFVLPVDSTRRTSFYGDRRVFVYSDGTRGDAVHAGIDFGIPTGTPVRSCAAGRVVMAKFRIVTGNSVVVEHLPGVYSLYYHLDRLGVKVGDRVKAGASLGRSGCTGLATGPHLHWELRVQGESADPDAFLGRAVLDKKGAISKMGKSSPTLAAGERP